MNKPWYVGVDIGLKGGICIMRENEPIELYPMPILGNEVDIESVDKLLWSFEGGDGMLIMERLGPIFGSSKATTWSMGGQVHIFKTICTIRSIPYTEVSAKVWQAEIFQGIKTITKKIKDKNKTDTKKMAAVAASRLFPTMRQALTSKSAKEHDGMVDALLITEYGKRKL